MTGCRVVLCSVVVVLLCTVGAGLSSTVVQAGMEKRAAMAKEVSRNVFIMELLFLLLFLVGFVA
jgi:hypothetical protein